MRRPALRNILFGVLASVGALALIGTTCLGRDPSKADTSTTTVRSSAGGPAIGRTELTWAEWERERAATTPATEEVREIMDSGVPSGGTDDDQSSKENP